MRGYLESLLRRGSLKIVLQQPRLGREVPAGADYVRCYTTSRHSRRRGLLSDENVRCWGLSGSTGERRWSLNLTLSGHSGTHPETGVFQQSGFGAPHRGAAEISSFRRIVLSVLGADRLDAGFHRLRLITASGLP